MKHPKALGLTAVAVAALLMAAGASFASASTTLCKVNETPCGEANMYPISTNISAGIFGSSALKAGFATVSCGSSQIQVKQEQTTTPRGNLWALNFSLCKDSLGRSCTVTVFENGELQIHAIEFTMNGNITMSGFRYRVVCGSTTCWYKGTILSGITLEGGELSPAIKVNEASVPLESNIENSFLCGSPSKWTATYLISSPAPLWVSPGV